MKNKVYKIVFGTFVFVATFIGAISVNALTIKETTNLNDNYDDIVDGTVIMGITKFEPNVVVTAGRASDATFNDVIFNYGSPGYDGVDIYYLLSGDWYYIDELNEASLVEDQSIIDRLNNSDIFYINNEEKMLEIPFSKKVEEGFELVFSTNNPEKDELVKYENGIIKVPATVHMFDVSVKEISTGNEKNLDHFEKNAKNDIEFEVVSSNGKIEGSVNSGTGIDYTVEGNKITVGGILPWVSADANEQNGRVAGNYASVKITAPELYTKHELLANATVKIDNRAAIDWEAVTLADGEDTYFVYYPRFDAETTSHTVTIEWVNGYKQVFTIELAETATLDLAPQGKIEGSVNSGTGIDYTVEGNKITVGGILPWVSADANEQNGRPAGNFASVKISANEVYTKAELLANATVKIDDRAAIDWEAATLADGEDTYFVYYPRFDAETTSHTVTIEWEEGSTQTFTIELAETATLDLAPQGKIDLNTKYFSTETVTTTNNNTITISGALPWYRDVENDENSGNIIAGTVTAPSEYNAEHLLDNTLVTIAAFNSEDEIVTESISLNADGSIFNGNTSFDFTAKATSDVEYIEISIKWENGNVQSFIIRLDGNLSFATKPETYTQSVSLNKETTDIIIGHKELLVATVLPQNATNKNVKWESSNNSVATVNENGEVTAVAYGTATITVTTLDGKFIDSCVVNSVYTPIAVSTINMGESVIDMAGVFSRQVNVSLVTTGGSGEYTYYFAIYNAKNGSKVGDTDSAGLDPSSNGFSLTIKDRTLAYRVEYKITDSVGTIKTGQFNIDAYES